MSRNDGVVNPYVPLQLCIGNVINNLVFGNRFEGDNTQLHMIKQSLDDLIGMNSSPLIFCTFHPWTRKLFIFRNIWNVFDSNLAKIFGFFEEQIAEHHKTFDVDAVPNDYVGAFLKEMKLKEGTGNAGSFSDRQLRSVVFDIWVAGLETTVTTLHWAILFMIHYPEYQQKVHEELDAVVGNDREIRMTDRNNLPYTAAFVQEVQRRANIVPINISRMLEKDMTILGHTIPAGSTIVPQISAVMWDERYFPEPKRFDPERFLEDGRLVKIEQMVPFSVGKRACMGEALARMELFIIFANFAQKFLVSKTPGEPYPPLACYDKFQNRAFDYTCKLTVRH